MIIFQYSQIPPLMMNLLFTFDFQNCSYIENPSYPSAYTTTGDCSFTVTRCSTGTYYYICCNKTKLIIFQSPIFVPCCIKSCFVLEICQVRLDFFKAVLQQPTSTTGSCTKTYTTITPGASGTTKYNTPPTLCGTLTGQHCKILYIVISKLKMSNIYVCVYIFFFYLNQYTLILDAVRRPLQQ